MHSGTLVRTLFVVVAGAFGCKGSRATLAPPFDAHAMAPVDLAATTEDAMAPPPDHAAAPGPETTATAEHEEEDEPADAATATAEDVLKRWNDAQARHDAKALGHLYAPTVVVTSDTEPNQRSSRAELMRSKADDFASAPDTIRALRNPQLFPDGSGGVYVEFSKVVTTQGRSKTGTAYLFIDGGRITAEGDGGEGPTVRWNWCVHDVPTSSADFLGVPRDKAIGGFRVAPLEAVKAAMRSKLVSEQRQRSGLPRVKAVITGCAQLCANFDPRGPMAAPPCTNDSGAYEITITNPTTGEGLEELEVDAMNGRVTAKAP